MGGVFEVARALVMSTAVRLLRAMLRFISMDETMFLTVFSAKTIQTKGSYSWLV